MSVIHGSLIIDSHDRLQSLEGLHRVTRVAADLRTTDNAGIIALDGLRGLIAVDGSLNIVGNSALNDIAALAGLDSLGGVGSSLIIERNPLLASSAAQAFAQRFLDDGFAGTVIIDRNSP